MPFKSTGILITYVALLIACTSSNRSSIPEADFYVQEGVSFGLRVGDTVGVITQSAINLVRFDLIREDSRCPMDVECVTAGFASVTITVQTALNVREVQFEMPPEGGVEVVVGPGEGEFDNELTLTFTGLLPPAMDGVEIGQLEYVLEGSGQQTAGLPTL